MRGLLHEYVNDSPRAAYRELADYLDSHDIRFIVTDYWTGYHVAFLTAERVKALTDFERIHEYTLAVRANLDRAMEVRRHTTPDQPCAGTLVGGLFCVCPPQTQTDRTDRRARRADARVARVRAHRAARSLDEERPDDPRHRRRVVVSPVGAQ